VLNEFIFFVGQVLMPLVQRDDTEAPAKLPAQIYRR